MVKPLDVLDKIGNFIEKYTGSNYGYTEPSGEIRDNYQQIGEIFGFPIYMDDNRRYENEFLDFPTLADILTSVANTGISFETKFSDCSVCLVINYSIPLVTYPPIIICLAKPDCKDEPEDRPCLPEAEYEKIIEKLKTYTSEEPPPQELLNKLKKPVCPDRPPGIPDAPEPFPDNRIPSGFGCFEFATNGTATIRDSYGQNETFPPTPYENLSWNTVCEGDYFDPLWNPGANIGEYIFDEQPGWFWSVSYRSRVVGRGFSVDHSLSMGWDYRYGGGSNSGSTKIFNWIVFRQIEGQPAPPLPPSKPVPPPIPDPTGDMNNNCCEDIKKILARIERQMRDVHRVLNPESFRKKEVQMPKNWLYPGNEGKPVVMDDYADLIAGVGRLIDRRLGYLPQMVRIKDSDPTKEGDQEINLVVNSLADANRLILEYLLQTHGDVSGIQMMNVANLYESGAIHQIAVVIREELEAISAYLGYADGKRKETFPMAFNPKIKISERSPESLDKLLTKFLTPTKQDVEVSTFNGKKTLVNQLNNIKRDTANSAAAVTRKLSDSSLEDLVEETQNIERLKRLLLIKEFQDREGIGDLGEFLKDAESAYPSTESPARRYDKPYGFQPTDKPKMQVTSKKSRKKKYKPDTNTK